MIVVLPAPVGPTSAATCPGSILKLTSLRIGLIRRVAEAHVLEFDIALEARRAPRAWQILHLAFGIQNFLDALVADRGLRIGVRHLRKLLHGLVHLAQIEDEDDQRTGRKRPVQHHARSEPQHHRGADRDDDVDDRRELGLQAPGPQRDLDAFQALFLKTPLFVILARERLHHANGREHFLDHRNDLAFLLSNLRARLS